MIKLTVFGLQCVSYVGQIELKIASVFSSCRQAYTLYAGVEKAFTVGRGYEFEQNQMQFPKTTST